MVMCVYSGPLLFFYRTATFSWVWLYNVLLFKQNEIKILSHLIFISCKYCNIYFKYLLIASSPLVPLLKQHLVTLLLPSITVTIILVYKV
jgi:hypothetical protein